MKKTWVEITSSICTPYSVTGSIGILDEKTTAYCKVHQKNAFGVSIILLSGNEFVWRENKFWVVVCEDNFVKIKSKDAIKSVLEALLKDQN